MWDTSGFVFTPAFNEVVLSLSSPELQQFLQEFVINWPEEPNVRRFRPIFRFFESFVISHMTEDYRNIRRNLRFSTFGGFLELVSESLIQRRDFVLMTLNRDSEGRRQRFPPVPLPGLPTLRYIFDFLVPEDEMNTRLWAETPTRFFLSFNPEIQEFISEDSGLESEG